MWWLRYGSTSWGFPSAGPRAPFTAAVPRHEALPRRLPPSPGEYAAVRGRRLAAAAAPLSADDGDVPGRLATPDLPGLEALHERGMTAGPDQKTWGRLRSVGQMETPLQLEVTDV